MNEGEKRKQEKKLKTMTWEKREKENSINRYTNIRMGNDKWVTMKIIPYDSSIYCKLLPSHVEQNDINWSVCADILYSNYYVPHHAS